MIKPYYDYNQYNHNTHMQAFNTHMQAFYHYHLIYLYFL